MALHPRHDIEQCLTVRVRLSLVSADVIHICIVDIPMRGRRRFQDKQSDGHLI